jgi:serine/threonine protein phosphatase PrpC
VIHNFGNCENQTFISVMDGHGPYGHEVSSFIKKQLPLLIESFLPSNSSDFKFGVEYLASLENSFKEGYKNTQKALVNKKTIDLNYSGSTCVSVLLREKLCICCNLGDSRAVIGKFNERWFPVDLSQDHKPSNIDEKRRIQVAGGRVEPFREETGEFVGPDRVWLLNEQLPGLAMSRAFGDLVASMAGVISEPDIVIHSLEPTDKFLVVATDGIWEFIESAECVKIVSEFYESKDVEKACDALMKKAVESWTREDCVVDDITFVVVFFNC